MDNVQLECGVVQTNYYLDRSLSGKNKLISILTNNQSKVVKLITKFWHLKSEFWHLKREFCYLKREFCYLKREFCHLKREFCYLKREFCYLKSEFLHLKKEFWTSRKNSLELIELSSINKVSLV